jgi:hypothetical protein
MAECSDGLGASRREQIRRLLDHRTLGPDGTVWAGPSNGDRPCFACGVTIFTGEHEFELVSPMGEPILCRLCYAIWEAERKNPPSSNHDE